MEPSPSGNVPSRRAAFAVLGAFVAVFLASGLLQAARDAPTVDEAVDLTAGLVAVEQRDLRMNPEHGLLHRVLPALLPSLLADPVVPNTTAYREGDWFDYTDDLISANDASGRLDEVVFWYRVIPLVVGASTGVLLYALGARLLGRGAGLVIAGLWLTTPYIVGLAHLSSLDISFACALVALAVLVDRYRVHPTDARLAALAAGFGVALLVRHSAIALAPVLAAVLLLEKWRVPWRQQVVGAAIVMLLPLVVVWSAYRIVDPAPVTGEPRERFDALIASASASGPLESLTLAVPMPIEWRAGFAYLVATSDERPAYLFGERWTGARPWFFPVSGLVKLPLTVPLALFIGTFGWAHAAAEVRRRALLAVGALAALFVTFMLVQPLNLGFRLIVPALALALVLAGGVLQLNRRVAVTIIAIMGLGQAWTFVAAHPSSLAWTPPPFSDGYRYVSDSSIDYGQANRAVREQHASQPFAAASLLAPRGYDVLTGVEPIEDVARDQLVGRVAVSATTLNVLAADDLAWLRAYCPVDVIDHAVLVYAFDRPPVQRPGPAVPEAPCADTEFSRRR